MQLKPQLKRNHVVIKKEKKETHNTKMSDF